MIPLGALAAPLLRAACAPRAASFRRALRDPAQSQRFVLGRILRSCVATDYGRRFGLRPDWDVDNFRRQVPVVSHEDIEPWLTRQRKEGHAVLTPGRIRCHEPTSGSSGAVKLIPYNDALLRSFRDMFSIWAHDLLRHRLRPRSGRIFISVSPAIPAGEGLADDRDYLAGLVRAIVGRFLLLSERMVGPQDSDAFRDAVATALLECGDLEIISVWSPGYLLAMMEHAEAHRERLLPRLSAKRRARLRSPLSWVDIWPQLQLVSCWTSASAEQPSQRLARLLPHASLQGKGLLATEAPLTLPLYAAGGAVPLVDEVFIELEEDGGALWLLDEAEQNREYSIVVTQAGGLLRYRLGDRVRVSGKHLGSPMLEFIGRAGAVADIAGEKLGEPFVAMALREATRCGSFATLLPVQPVEGRPRYWLLTDDLDPSTGARLEAALSRAFRYREARFIGQLDAVQVLARVDMRRVVQDAMVSCGMKMGDIKEAALLTRTDFAGRVLAFVSAGQTLPE